MFAVLINLSARKENLHFDVFKLKIQFINFKASLFTSFHFRMETERNVTEKNNHKIGEGLLIHRCVYQE